MSIQSNLKKYCYLFKLLIDKRFILLTICLTIGGILYFIFGHRIIEAIYKGEATAFLNKEFKGRTENPLSFYLRKADLLYLSANILISSFVLSYPFFFKLITNYQTTVFGLKNEFAKLKLIGKNKNIILTSLCLFITFYYIYFSIGLLFIPYSQKITFLGQITSMHFLGGFL
ncbi:hypothetical protein [Gloeocapsopsis dulcis]|uniref:Uncharacterized protein n=1 Tax=Gloeocapsopsis dulcis AAB1 = 1H9 TaxID=1433147 RepID=A0A6N8FWP5_9CHRO|nr:hypothetical protein [Gloeocapsopsis dulcis]MUL36567.1 hypothetical protein [Gloeocapsopsis dulcis AAB1 = 1H9]WNN87191.1 hypothetical protein P0S91_12655 [Gloeocapsopsis dulcis]